MTTAPKRTFVLFAAIVFGTVAAAAQSAPPPPRGDSAMGAPKEFSTADFAKHRTEMCQMQYAAAVGHFAALETRLNLTGKQKPAFDKWKAIKLSAEKSRATACTDMPIPPPQESNDGKAKAPSPVEALKRHEQQLKDELVEIKAEEPALEALAGVLGEEQLRLLNRPPHGGPHDFGPDRAPHGDGHSPQGGPDQPPPPCE